MISITGILVITFAAAMLTFVLHHLIPQLRNIVAIVAVAVVGYIAWQLPVDPYLLHFNIGPFNIIWGNSEYSRLFAVLISVLSLFALIYSSDFMAKQENLGFYYLNFLLSVGGMFGIVYSQDLVSLFFFWEIMTWSSFMMVIYCCKEAQPVGLKYFVFSAIGAYAILIALVLIYANLGSVTFIKIFAGFDSMSFAIQLSVVILMLIGFGVKAAVMPMHVWAPDAYATAPLSYTAVFSGVLSKMGVFGIGLLLFKFTSEAGFYPYVQSILAWIGALTAMLATFYAVFQDDARKLLAYSSVGQLGYIIVGLAIGTPMAIAAALFLAIIHGAFKGILFYATGAVYYRTGTTDMTKVSGLIRKMPFTFFSALLAIIAVSGVPPLGGFVSKWMLYEALISNNNYFLVIIVFAASTGAFLYLYRFIFSFWLGQEEKEFEDVTEVPWSMRAPMVLLALFTLIVGLFPGLLLDPISKVITYFGVKGVSYESSVLFNTWGNKVDMNTVISIITIVFIAATLFLIWKNRKQTRYATTKDIHTSGEIPTEEENLTYQLDFYKPFERALGWVLKPSVNKMYNKIADNLEETFNHLRFVYTGNGQTYAMYVVIFLVILILFSELIFNVKL
jgi:NADH-quinone oxidoreductase subunit M